MIYEVKLSQTDFSNYPLDLPKLQSGLDDLLNGYLSGAFNGTSFNPDSVLTLFGVNCNQYDFGNIISAKINNLNLENESFIYCVLNASNFISIGPGNSFNLKLPMFINSFSNIDYYNFEVKCGNIQNNNYLPFNSNFNFFVKYRNDYSIVDQNVNETLKLNGVCLIGSL